jgi:NADPH2:quinone reductase
MPLPSPFVVGCDLAGTVVEAGSNTKQFKVGQRVWGSNQGLLGRQGTFAEFAAVEEDWLYPLPDGVREEDAAAMALVGITAHLGLVREARLRAGEVLFVNGGTGGVGSTVVQMARALGARVITTAGTEAKIQTARKLGADVALNYKTQNVDEQIKAAAPKGVDVWWETLREPNFERTIPLLADRGRMIVMAGRDAKPVFPVGPFYVKGCSLHGFAMFQSTPEEQRRPAEDLNRWLAEGKIRPLIDRILSLSKAAEAHRLQEENTIGKAGTLGGKIVLRP